MKACHATELFESEYPTNLVENIVIMHGKGAGLVMII